MARILTNSQRTKIKMAKIGAKEAKYKMLGKQKTAIGVAKELGGAATNIAASYAAQRGMQSYNDSRVAKSMSDDTTKALAAYANAILGKGSESSSGTSGTKSTTEVGGSGSAIGG